MALAPEILIISLTLQSLAAYITDPFNLPFIAGVHSTILLTPANFAKIQFINAVLGRLLGQ